MKKKFHFQIGGASELYLPYFVEKNNSIDDNQTIKVPIQNLITIFVIKMAEKMDNESLSNVKIYFKPEPFPEKEGIAISLNRNCLSELSIIAEGENVNNVLIDSCVLPAIYIPEINLCVSGLCSGLHLLRIYFVLAVREKLGTFISSKNSL